MKSVMNANGHSPTGVVNNIFGGFEWPWDDEVRPETAMPFVQADTLSCLPS